MITPPTLPISMSVGEGADTGRVRPTTTADAEAFRTAWSRFTDICAVTVAPEATYQAWLAHFLMEQVDVLRVVREVDFGSRHLLPEDTPRFPGHNLMVDIAVLRKSVVDLPRRAHLRKTWSPDSGTPDPASGLGRIGLFSVISELKVASTQGEGLDQAQVLRDFYKLSAILNAAERHPGVTELPTAFVGVLGNHARHPYHFYRLHERLVAEQEAGRIRPDVELLAFGIGGPDDLPILD